jgi:hypothetical protein
MQRDPSRFAGQGSGRYFAPAELKFPTVIDLNVFPIASSTGLGRRARAIKLVIRGEISSRFKLSKMRNPKPIIHPGLLSL